MKVLAINGSPRKDDYTAILIRYVFGELETSSNAGADNRIQPGQPAEDARGGMEERSE